MALTLKERSDRLKAVRDMYFLKGAAGDKYDPSALLPKALLEAALRSYRAGKRERLRKLASRTVGRVAV